MLHDIQRAKGKALTQLAQSYGVRRKKRRRKRRKSSFPFESDRRLRRRAEKVFKRVFLGETEKFQETSSPKAQQKK